MTVVKSYSRDGGWLVPCWREQMHPALYASWGEQGGTKKRGMWGGSLALGLAGRVTTTRPSLRAPTTTRTATRTTTETTTGTTTGTTTVRSCPRTVLCHVAVLAAAAADDAARASPARWHRRGAALARRAVAREVPLLAAQETRHRAPRELLRLGLELLLPLAVRVLPALPLRLGRHVRAARGRDGRQRALRTNKLLLLLFVLLGVLCALHPRSGRLGTAPLSATRCSSRSRRRCTCRRCCRRFPAAALPHQLVEIERVVVGCTAPCRRRNHLESVVAVVLLCTHRLLAHLAPQFSHSKNEKANLEKTKRLRNDRTARVEITHTETD